MSEIKLLRKILPCLAPQPSLRLAIIDVDEKRSIGLVEDVIPHRSLSYCKLPEALLKLSVLKLDGSCFDVKIADTASVADLKQAVEDVFKQSHRECQGTISWSHVWGHFCLCYRGYKLTNDKKALSDFRLKDGDQLQFIRHLSIHNVPTGKPKKRANSKSHRRNSKSDDGTREVEDDRICDKFSGDNHDKIHSFKFRDEFRLAKAIEKWISMRSKRRVHFHRHASDDYLRGKEGKLSFARLESSP